MKKIFAIALALVMVLSMASAFASPCTAGFDWTKVDTTACGKAKVEVVPYVKVSNGCGGYDWQVSECAGSVKDEKVYFAIRLTVDADMDMEWWNKAALTISSTGMTSNYTKAALDKTGVASSDKEAVYYYKWEGSGSWVKVGTEAGQIDVADDVEAASAVSVYMKGMEVADSSKAKVCVNLNSTGNDFVRGTVGKYYVEYITENGQLVLKVWEKQTAKNPLAVYTIVNDKVVKVDYTNAGSCAPYDVASIKAFFGIYEGTTITTKLVNKNFGWDNKISDCNTWSSNVTAIVDTDCVVAIPKTGDASVLAWLF